MEMYDYLIVGAGLFGSMFAKCATDRGKKCIVIDKRPHIAGNLYSEKIEGINVHKYGAHIFHTSNPEVWSFVNEVVEFNRFTNSPLASYKGQIYNLPFNMNTFRQLWGVKTPREAKLKIQEQVRDFNKKLKAEGVQSPRNLEEQALSLVGHDIYEKFIRGYTQKQWGRRCSELPAFIIRRLPLRYVYDNNYFSDKYQGVPVGGYTKFVEKLLAGSEVVLNANFFDKREHWENVAKHIVYTGRIDEFFDFRFGRLEYRSLRFENEIQDCSNYQGNAVVNYTDADIPYTRIIEHKHFESFGEEVEKNPKTIISREFPVESSPSMEPYYPVNDDNNTALYAKYAELAGTTKGVFFGGRLAEYKYYDMAPIVEKVLEIWKHRHNCDVK